MNDLAACDFRSPAGAAGPEGSQVVLGRQVLAVGAPAGPVLGIDTGSPIMSLGIVRDGRIAAALSRSAGSHCAALPAAVDEILADANILLQDLVAVAVAIGPGSFTGLRIGLSYAKGLASGRGLQIAGVPTLDALALCALDHDLDEGTLVCPILDAHRGEVYTGLYRFVTDALQKLTGDLVVPLVQFITEIDGSVVFVGDSKAAEAGATLGAECNRATVAAPAQLHLRGSFVAAIGAARVACNDKDEAASLEPLYVRPPDTAAHRVAVKPIEDRPWSVTKKN